MDETRESLLIAIDEADGEMRMIHERLAGISDPLSDEYVSLRKEYSYWAQIRIDLQKQYDASVAREDEAEAKKKEHKGNFWRNVLVFGGTIIGGVFTFGSQVYASKKHKEEFDEGLKFEETGTFTSVTNRGNVGRTPGAKKF